MPIQQPAYTARQLEWHGAALRHQWPLQSRLPQPRDVSIWASYLLGVDIYLCVFLHASCLIICRISECQVDTVSPRPWLVVMIPLKAYPRLALRCQLLSTVLQAVGVR